MAKQRTDERLYDVRLRTRLLKDQTITQKDVDEFLSQLPDATENVETSEVRLDKSAGPEI